ncbi:nitrogen regulation protein NR(II) [Endozoicomonas gorgoniicola]|uniref:Sensory histidine kinase/phosphatase NtrB n=1 Tax=Endozoicomonas gorgoniicola TaxID=1234144 RepID=A0ABT3N2H4_9GAMM|nr:nitrogen regulation protein NR(II) [Endozoicomonas gorgoniicola]MCW7555827.1 nitrogen regulation protein NR(II) [Endozoicomonas gorgoniicola]
MIEQFVLDNLNTAVIALDRELRVSYLNHAAENLLDISERRSYSQPVETLLTQPGLEDDLKRAQSQQQPFTRRKACIRINSETVTVDYTVTPVDYSDFSILLEIHPRDRLQRITREASLVAKQETAKSLARGMAHEVKNPLGGIRGAAQLLERQLNDNGQKEFTTIIIEEVDRLRDLVDQMLGPVKPPCLKALNVHEVIERVMQLTEAETGGAIQFVRDYDPSIPEIPADRERLIQAVLNLVRNAMQAIEQHMPLSDGQITIQTRVIRQFTIANERCRLVCNISIIDNGPGIPEDMIETIFYPMISGRAEGTGLGLPMAQSIISQHKGLIECESKPGRTCFNVYIPIAL